MARIDDSPSDGSDDTLASEGLAEKAVAGSARRTLAGAPPHRYLLSLMAWAGSRSRSRSCQLGRPPLACSCSCARGPFELAEGTRICPLALRLLCLLAAPLCPSSALASRPCSKSYPAAAVMLMMMRLAPLRA